MSKRQKEDFATKEDLRTTYVCLRDHVIMVNDNLARVGKDVSSLQAELRTLKSASPRREFLSAKTKYRLATIAYFIPAAVLLGVLACYVPDVFFILSVVAVTITAVVLTSIGIVRISE